jgi:hypothetical protein
LEDFSIPITHHNPINPLKLILSPIQPFSPITLYFLFP